MPISSVTVINATDAQGKLQATAIGAYWKAMAHLSLSFKTVEATDKV